MDENRTNTIDPEKEEEGIDIMAMVRGLWDGRKTIIICTAIFIVLGLFSALTMKRSYTVTSMMVPQLGSSKNSSLSALAGLAGLDMGMNQSGELSPLVYPQIVSSVPFRLELMHTPLHYEKCDTMISMYDYMKSDYNKPTVADYIKRYTIGLPGVILGSLRSKPQEVVYVGDGGGNKGPRPLVLTRDEQKMQEAFNQIVSLAVDKKEGNITLTVHGSEPIQTAELAMKAQQLLQDEITRFRVEKSEGELEYIQARYNEVKEEHERYQVMLASANDRTQNVATTSARVGRDRIQAKYNVSNAVFMEMAKQLEQAKMQVKKDTPVFTIVQPVTVPMKASNSRAKTLIVWTFLGIVLGCGIVIAKGYWPKLKEKLTSPEKAE
ncbi:MAG: hypothetical protein K6E96_06585 [Bacteroidales bacterium]|nr:hypothetical protein [Bacteroidales bacterium]